MVVMMPTGTYMGSLDGGVTGRYQCGFAATIHTAIMPCQPNTTYTINVCAG